MGSTKPLRCFLLLSKSTTVIIIIKLFHKNIGPCREFSNLFNQQTLFYNNYPRLILYNSVITSDGGFGGRREGGRLPDIPRLTRDLHFHSRLAMCLTHSLGNARWADGGDGFLWCMLLGGGEGKGGGKGKGRGIPPQCAVLQNFPPS